jgi:hypothetical protein
MSEKFTPSYTTEDLDQERAARAEAREKALLAKEKKEFVDQVYGVPGARNTRRTQEANAYEQRLYEMSQENPNLDPTSAEGAAARRENILGDTNAITYASNIEDVDPNEVHQNSIDFYDVAPEHSDAAIRDNELISHSPRLRRIQSLLYRLDETEARYFASKEADEDITEAYEQYTHLQQKIEELIHDYQTEEHREGGSEYNEFIDKRLNKGYLNDEDGYTFDIVEGGLTNDKGESITRVEQFNNIVFDAQIERNEYKSALLALAIDAGLLDYKRKYTDMDESGNKVEKIPLMSENSSLEDIQEALRAAGISEYSTKEEIPFPTDEDAPIDEEAILRDPFEDETRGEDEESAEHLERGSVEAEEETDRVRFDREAQEQAIREKQARTEAEAQAAAAHEARINNEEERMNANHLRRIGANVLAFVIGDGGRTNKENVRAFNGTLANVRYAAETSGEHVNEAQLFARAVGHAFGVFWKRKIRRTR